MIFIKPKRYEFIIYKIKPYYSFYIMTIQSKTFKTATLLCATVMMAILLFSCNKKQEGSMTQAEYDSLSVEDRYLSKNAVAGLAHPEDVEVTLFASEPMLTNPTDMDIDAKGRVWICEGYNYRNQLNPVNPYKKAGDRILILEDTDHDGKADTSKVFYQGEDVNSALGIAVLGNKVIVSCSPNVFVFTDENGDDKADKKEVLFQGLDGVQHDHAIHAFSFGPDGKLYFNFGNAGKHIRDKNGKPLVDKNGDLVTDEGKPYRQGMAFRCDIDGSNIEVLGHNFRNNYELAVDAFGRMWQSDNDDDGNKGTRINYVMDYGNYGYTDEMTGAGWEARRTNMEDSIPQRHWHLNDPGVVPNVLQTGAGSPTGIMVYEGDLLPIRFQNQVIHCDAGPMVVRAYPMLKDGAGFTATINPLLESRPNNTWFRPSDVTTAPDGSVFVADWYDPGVGGHAMGDSTRGRIFRITPKNHDEYTIPTFDFKTAEGCAEALQNANLAVRYIAWTALQAMGTKAEEALAKMMGSENPRYKARALGVLAKIPGLEKKYIDLALKEENEDLRVAAIRFMRELPNFNSTPYLQALAKDKSPQVRKEVALALHNNKIPEAAAIWTDLAGQHDGKDRWYLEALGIGAAGQWDAFMDAWTPRVKSNWNKTAANKDIIWRSRSKSSLTKLATLIEQSSDKDRLRYFRAFDFHSAIEKTDVLLGLLKNTNADITLLVLKHLDPAKAASSAVFRQTLPKVLADIKNPHDYFDIVSKYNLKNQKAKLLGIAMTYPDSSLGKEAANILMATNGTADVVPLLNNNDKETAMKALNAFAHSENPVVMQTMAAIIMNKNKPEEIRSFAVETLSSWNGDKYMWENLILNKKASGDAKMAILKKLSGSWRSDIRTNSMKMLSADGGGTEALGSIAELSKLTGKAENGKTVYNSYCQTCHMVGKEGINFGPGLSEIGTKYGKEGLLASILNPSAGISFGYEGHILTMKDGSEMQGIVASQTESEIILKMPGSNEMTKIKRADVVKNVEMKESMMPKFQFKKQEIVDLVEYLSTLKKK
jgi:putative membrane-bound dehydrogenase-like protein